MRKVEIANEGAYLAVSFHAPGATPTTLRVPHIMAAPIGAALLGAAELGLWPYDTCSALPGRHRPIKRTRREEAAFFEGPSQQTAIIHTTKDLPMTHTKPTAMENLGLPEVRAPIGAPAGTAPPKSRVAIERQLKELEQDRAKVDAKIEFLKEMLAVAGGTSQDG